MSDLLISKPEGLYCPGGDFFIDPWKPVKHAVVTHGHGDHASSGSKAYLAAAPSKGILIRRMQPGAVIETLPYGTRLKINDVTVSFHPAGHVLGSGQVRVERAGEVWVVTGDYKLQADPTCAPFEPVRCDVFITESTFALPIYHWPDPAGVLAEIHAWWRANQAMGRTSIIFAYPLGKAQRILASLDTSIGPVLAHGAIEGMNAVYRASGVALPPTPIVDLPRARAARGQALVIAPPSARTSPWIRKLDPYSTAFASGWMIVRGARRRRALDRGFVLSDHADWPGLLQAVKATGAPRIGVTHGSTHVLARHLKEQGYDSFEIESHYSETLETEEAEVAA